MPSDEPAHTRGTSGTSALISFIASFQSWVRVARLGSAMDLAIAAAMAGLSSAASQLCGLVGVTSPHFAVEVE